MNAIVRSAVERLWMAMMCLMALPVVAAAGEFDPLANDIAMVLTPTRLRQSLADVPGSVTVLTAEMLAKFGIRSIPEALRLVPGMAVTQVSGNDYRINYHGGNVQAPRRMNVLIDGVSEYRPAFARVDWKDLPVAVEDIERIEVTRGPNSASYGANSMLAIINIITKHPKEVEGTTIKAIGGTRDTREGLVRYGGKMGEATSYRLTAEHQQDRGFNAVANAVSATSLDHDRTRINRVNFRSVTDIGHHETLDLQVALLQGLNESQYFEPFQQTFPDVHLREVDVSARWRKAFSSTHEVQVQGYATQHRHEQSWRTCLPTVTLLPQLFDLWRSNPGYVETIAMGRMPSGGTPQDNALAAAALSAYRSLGARALVPTCVDANQNYLERRLDVELQDTWVYSNAIRMVSGVGVRQELGDSQTYLGGQVRNHSGRAFANVEYKLSVGWNINAGGYLEKDEITGSSFSPRVAVNRHLNENSTIRVVASKATRMPDILEQRANWTYRATNFSVPLGGATEGFFAESARSPGNVKGEKILSTEIGYFGNFPQYGLLLDAKVFNDRLKDLVSERLQLSDFSPTNRNAARLRGAELQATIEPTDRWMMHLAYSYLDIDATTVLEQGQYARHSGAFGITHLLSNDWRCSLAVYGNGANAPGQTFFGREDLTLSKTFRLGRDASVTPTLSITHLDNRSVQVLRDFDKITQNTFADAMQYYLTVKLTY